MKKATKTDFTFDSGCTINDEEFDETREWIKEEAANIDSGFLEFDIEHEPANDHFIDGMRFREHEAHSYAVTSDDAYRADVTDAPVVPKAFTLKVDTEQDSTTIKGTVDFVLNSVLIYGETMVAEYCVKESNLECEAQPYDDFDDSDLD